MLRRTLFALLVATFASGGALAVAPSAEVDTYGRPVATYQDDDRLGPNDGAQAIEDTEEDKHELEEEGFPQYNP